MFIEARSAMASPDVFAMFGDYPVVYEEEVVAEDKADSPNSTSRVNMWQILQSVLIALILAVVVGIYNLGTQVAVMQSQMGSVLDKVNNIPTITTNTVALQVQMTDLERRTTSLERAVNPPKYNLDGQNGRKSN